MIVTTKEIKKKLRAEVPGLADTKLDMDILLRDPAYKLLSLLTFEKIKAMCSMQGMKFIPDVFDCDDYALVLRARFRQLQYDLIQAYPPMDKQYAWFFPECLSVHAIHGPHNTNITITDDWVIRYTEPQTNEMTTKFNGKIYFIDG